LASHNFAAVAVLIKAVVVIPDTAMGTAFIAGIKQTSSG